MQADRMSLAEDVKALQDAPLPHIRQNIAAKVADLLNESVLDSSERRLACDIIKLLAKDIEVSVRKTLAEKLRSNPDLPYDVALGMARDVLEVSLPVLEYSPALTEEDLIGIIRSTKQVAKLTAIARRRNISEAVSGELAGEADEDVIVSLLTNNSARMSKHSFEFIIYGFKGNGKVLNILMGRGGLPPVIITKILGSVSAQMREELVRSHKLNPAIADDIIKETFEEKTIASVSNNYASGEKVVQTEQLVSHLFRNNKLTESMIIRSICEGNLLFFEVSMARRAGIPIVNARALIRDGNMAGLGALWKRAKMPDSAFESIAVIIKFVVQDIKRDGNYERGFDQRLLEYIQGNGHHNTPLMSYMMAIIGSKIRMTDLC